MITRKIDPSNPDPVVLAEAQQVLASGGIVIHPTDTAYGLAANIFDEKAIEKIHEIKGRDFSKGLIVCVRDLVMADTLVDLNASALKLLETFTPGPLTVALPKKSVVPKNLSGDHDSLAIRIPDCLVTLQLSELCPFPYSTTSANPSGKANPYSAEDILREFPKEKLNLVDLFLDAGHLPEIKPSTIVDLTTNEPKVIREGPISSSEVFSCLKQLTD